MTVITPRVTRWPFGILIASLVPMLLLCAFITWYQLVFRPSGQERWGDAAVIFYLGAWSYPLSLLLLLVGCVWLYKLGREPLRKSLSFIISLLSANALALVAPFVLVLLFAAR